MSQQYSMFYCTSGTPGIVQVTHPMPKWDTGLQISLGIAKQSLLLLQYPYYISTIHLLSFYCCLSIPLLSLCYPSIIKPITVGKENRGICVSGARKTIHYGAQLVVQLVVQLIGGAPHVRLSRTNCPQNMCVSLPIRTSWV